MNRVYKAFINNSGNHEIYGNLPFIELINIGNPEDKLISLVGEFEENEIVNEEDIDLRSTPYLSISGQMSTVELAVKIPKVFNKEPPYDLSRASIVDELKTQLDYYMRRCEELEAKLSAALSNDDPVL